MSKPSLTLLYISNASVSACLPWWTINQSSSACVMWRITLPPALSRIQHAVQSKQYSTTHCSLKRQIMEIDRIQYHANPCNARWTWNTTTDNTIQYFETIGMYYACRDDHKSFLRDFSTAVPVCSHHALPGRNERSIHAQGFFAWSQAGEGGWKKGAPSPIRVSGPNLDHSLLKSSLLCHSSHPKHDF